MVTQYSAALYIIDLPVSHSTVHRRSHGPPYIITRFICMHQKYNVQITINIQHYNDVIGPFCGAIAVPSVTRCRCCCRWTSILHCHSPGVATVARRLRYSYSWLRPILVVVSTVATPGEWQCNIRTGGVQRLAVANGPNILKMFLVIKTKLTSVCLWGF